MEPQKVRLTVVSERSPAPAEVPLALVDMPLVPLDVQPFDRSSLRPDERRPLRTSSYTIYSDLPGDDHDVLLVHGFSGAYDKVSRRLADYLKAHEIKADKPLHGEWTPEPAVDADVAIPSEELIQKLKKRGYLTQLTLEEEESLFARMASQRHAQATRGAPSYILMPTYECNLRCAYCFQDHMRTDPSYSHLLRIMDRPMVDRILKGMTRIEAAHGVPEGFPLQRSITLFGGEPLLEQSRPIVEYLVDQLLALGPAHISAITNGTDLDAYRDLLGPEKISWLQITIDGPADEHDKRRIYADGSGSFEKIARNIDMALDRGVKISVRMNVDRTNIRFLPALGEDFAARGWTARAGFSAYVAPVTEEGKPSGERTTFNSWELNLALAELKQTHASMRALGGNDDGLVERARKIFDRRADPVPSMRSDFCSAHTGMYIFDAFGDVYACWDRTGDPSTRIGRVDESGEVFMNRAIMETWRSRSVTSNPVCRKCRYASYCGGGCAVLAEGQNGSLHSNHCDGFSKRFRASAARAYLDHVSGAELTGSSDRVCDQ